MDTFDLKNYLNNNPLLNEIKVNPPLSFSQQDMEALDVLVEFYGEGDSGFDLYEPMGELYNLDNYEPNDEEHGNPHQNKQYKALKHLLTKPSGVYLIPRLFSFPPAPGAPEKTYDARVTINREYEFVKVETPYLDNEGSYSVGWFGADKEYYPDTVNFDEDGEYIGGAE
jgi:hypothetical protein